VGAKQTATLSFTLHQLVSTSTDGSKIKQNLDSILQLQPSLSSTLTIKIQGSGATATASMQYKVQNVGSSSVEPQQVTTKLKDLLNSQGKSVTRALSVLGVVKLGTRGCCSSATQAKQLAVSDAGSGSGSNPSGGGGNQNPNPNAPSGQTQTVTGSFTMTVDNVASFVNDTTAVTAVKNSIANQASISASVVAVQLVQLRRLRESSSQEKDSLRRLTSGSARADYTITLPASLSSADQTTAINSISAMTTTGLTTELASQMTSLSLSYSVTVTSVNVVVPTTTPAATVTQNNEIDNSGSVVPYLGGSMLLFVLGIFFWA
jgi:hypothetical protein